MMHLKTSAVESWLFWTGRTKPCQRLSLWKEEKAPSACLLLIPGIGPKILSSGRLCPEPLAPFQWSAWNQGPAVHYAWSGLDGTQVAKKMWESIPGGSRMFKTQDLITLNPLSLSCRAWPWKGSEEVKYNFILTHNPMIHPKSFVFLFRDCK